MKTLQLLRHAKSSWDDPGLDDHDRPLAPRGQKAARRIASHIGRQQAAVDLVLCSSATRARQTLELVRPSLGRDVEIRVEHGLYGAGANDLLDRLQRVDETTRAVLVVGHNPGLQDLTELLLGGGDARALEQLRQKFPTGALATLTTEMRWRGLGPGGARLESLVVPRALKPS